MSGKLLVILQNAWGVEHGYEPSYERESFRKSHTGIRLLRAIPAGADVHIVNASPEVGTESSSNFPPSPAHVQARIEKVQPKAILACGVNAQTVVHLLRPNIPVVEMPHPAYRALTNKTLDNVRQKLYCLLEQ